MPYLLLWVDEGGIRGHAMLIVLRQLMEYVALLEKEMGEDKSVPRKPADYFDYIGGTGLGG
jgi:patatin-like phospholipase/acyl hydrolase